MENFRNGLTGPTDLTNRLYAFVFPAGFALLGSVASAFVAIAGLASLVSVLTGKLRIWRGSGLVPVTAVTVLFVVSGLIAGIATMDTMADLGPVLGKLVFLAIAPLAAAFMFSPWAQLKQNLETGASIGAIAVAIFVVVEILFWRERAWGGAGNPGPFALVMSVAFSISILAIASAGSRREEILHSLGGIAALFCITASGMRAMLPILIVAPIVALWMRSGFPQRPGRRRLMLFIVVAGFCLGILAAGNAWQRIMALEGELAQLFAGTGYGTSVGNRLVMWAYAVERIPQSPWVGFGVNGSLEGLNEYAQANYGIEIRKTHFHNFVLTALMRGGIIDLAATLAILFGPLVLCLGYRGTREGRYGISLLSCVLAAYLMSGMLNILFGHDIVDHYFVLMTAMGVALSIKGGGEGASQARAALP